MSPKITLRSKINPEFSIEVGSRVIDSCSILNNANTSEPIELDMTPQQLEKFVEFHNHFKGPEAPKDPEWTNAFFKEFTEDEFKDLCWKADYLFSQRFLEAAGDFILSKLEDMSMPELQEYLNIPNDYSPEEIKAMEEHPLEFFTGIQQDQPQAANNELEEKMPRSLTKDLSIVIAFFVVLGSILFIRFWS